MNEDLYYLQKKVHHLEKMCRGEYEHCNKHDSEYSICCESVEELLRMTRNMKNYLRSNYSNTETNTIHSLYSKVCQLEDEIHNLVDHPVKLADREERNPVVVNNYRTQPKRISFESRESYRPPVKDDFRPRSSFNRNIPVVIKRERKPREHYSYSYVSQTSPSMMVDSYSESLPDSRYYNYRPMYEYISPKSSKVVEYVPIRESKDSSYNKSRRSPVKDTVIYQTPVNQTKRKDKTHKRRRQKFAINKSVPDLNEERSKDEVFLVKRRKKPLLGKSSKGEKESYQVSRLQQVRSKSPIKDGQKSRQKGLFRRNRSSNSNKRSLRSLGSNSSYWSVDRKKNERNKTKSKWYRKRERNKVSRDGDRIIRNSDIVVAHSYGYPDQSVSSFFPKENYIGQYTKHKEYSMEEDEFGSDEEKLMNLKTHNSSKRSPRKFENNRNSNEGQQSEGKSVRCSGYKNNCPVVYKVKLNNREGWEGSLIFNSKKAGRLSGLNNDHQNDKDSTQNIYFIKRQGVSKYSNDKYKFGIQDDINSLTKHEKRPRSNNDKNHPFVGHDKNFIPVYISEYDQHNSPFVNDEFQNNVRESSNTIKKLSLNSKKVSTSKSFDQNVSKDASSRVEAQGVTRDNEDIVSIKPSSQTNMSYTVLPPTETVNLSLSTAAKVFSHSSKKSTIHSNVQQTPQQHSGLNRSASFSTENRSPSARNFKRSFSQKSFEENRPERDSSPKHLKRTDSQTSQNDRSTRASNPGKLRKSLSTIFGRSSRKSLVHKQVSQERPETRESFTTPSSTKLGPIGSRHSITRQSLARPSSSKLGPVGSRQSFARPTSTKLGPTGSTHSLKKTKSKNKLKGMGGLTRLFKGKKKNEQKQSVVRQSTSPTRRSEEIERVLSTIDPIEQEDSDEGSLNNIYQDPKEKSKLFKEKAKPSENCLDYSLHYSREKRRCVEMCSVPSTLTIPDCLPLNCRKVLSVGEIVVSEHKLNDKPYHNRFKKTFGDPNGLNHEITGDEWFCRVCTDKVQDSKLRNTPNQSYRGFLQGCQNGQDTLETGKLFDNESTDWKQIVKEIKNVMNKN